MNKPVRKKIEESCRYKTQRLSVCSWKEALANAESDLSFARRVIQILSPEVTKALPEGWQNMSSVDDAQTWIREREKESHFLSVRLISENIVAGFIFLYESKAEDDLKKLRFGYLLSEEVWGQGLGTELIEGLVNWCKAEGNIKSISGGVETDNIGSIRVLEKAGFTISNEDTPKADVIFYEYRFDIEET